MCKFLLDSLFSFLLERYLGVELPCHVVTPFHLLGNCQAIFHRSCLHHFPLPLAAWECVVQLLFARSSCPNVLIQTKSECGALAERGWSVYPQWVQRTKYNGFANASVQGTPSETWTPSLSVVFAQQAAYSRESSSLDLP